MVGMAGATSLPPPPRRGFAIRLPALAKLKPPGEFRPRVLPALASSRRSLTAASWTSNLVIHCQCCLAEKGQTRGYILVVGGSHLLLTIL